MVKQKTIRQVVRDMRDLFDEVRRELGLPARVKVSVTEAKVDSIQTDKHVL